MAPADIVIELTRQRGIAIWGEGARIRYRAPAGAEMSDIRALVERCRPELWRLLQDRSSCAQCRRATVVMVMMEAGVDGVPWALCARCWTA